MDTYPIITIWITMPPTTSAVYISGVTPSTPNTEKMTSTVVPTVGSTAATSRYMSTMKFNSALYDFTERNCASTNSLIMPFSALVRSEPERMAVMSCHMVFFKYLLWLRSAMSSSAVESAVETAAGALVGGDTYELQARFTNSGGLNPGSNVIVAGVTIGRIEAIRLNPKDYSAVVTFRVLNTVKLPTDSIASIKTTGLIGDKFLSIAPGGDAEFLAPGTLITDTESTVDLESLISRFAFGNVSPKPKPSETK